MTLLQCAHGRAYERLLELSRPWHRRILPGWNHKIFLEPRGIRPPTWDKCRRLLETLQDAPDGEIVLYLDCDALIRLDIAAALRNAMQGHDFGAVENAWGIFNGGVQAWVASEKTRRVAAAIEQQGPDLRAPAQEQDTVDFYARRQLRCVTLPRNWNNYPNARGSLMAEPIYIKAWHGLGAVEALPRMEAEIEKLSHAA